MDPVTPASPASPRLLNAGSAAVVLGFAVAAAIAFNPLFKPPFWVMLLRCLFVGGVLLLAFAGAQRWPEDRLPRWLPRWLLAVLAVAVAAPLATAAVYVVSAGGQLSELFIPARVTGFAIIAGTALVLGMIIALTAQLREREQRARALALEVELERSRSEKQAADARLALLQAQIEPHFLFNTLANVQALVESGSPRAAPVLASLISYLRAAMPRFGAREATLCDELALVRAYLALMQMRMPDRLTVEIAVPDTLLGDRFPAMALLTLVENAVRHGIDPQEDGGRVQVGGAVDGRFGRLWVQDDGAGLSETAGNGTGLTNLQSRLAGFYGSGAALQLHDALPHGLKAEIVWPR